MTHEEGLRGRYRRDLVRVKLQLEGDLMRRRKKSCQRFFRRLRVAREKREVEVRGRTEPLQCSRCISGDMADDVSIAEPALVSRRDADPDWLCCGPPPPLNQPRKNEDPQFELRFPWRDLKDSLVIREGIATVFDAHSLDAIRGIVRFHNASSI